RRRMSTRSAWPTSRGRSSASPARSSDSTRRAGSCIGSSRSDPHRTHPRCRRVTRPNSASGAAQPGRTGANRQGRAAARVASGIFISRVLGLVRDRLVAFFFGSSDFADVWRAALRMPNVVQNLLGEGTLSASLIPVYAEMIQQGREKDAGRFAGAALGILTAVAGGIVLVGWALAPILVQLFFPRWDAEKQALTAQLVRILFPMTGVRVISAWA